MATCNNGYMGAFNGKLGTAVAYTWKGRQCLRAHQPWIRDPRTKPQQRRRTMFGAMSSLAASMSEATHIGLRGIASERQANIASTFIHLNHHCVSIVDGEAVIDYAALRVSDGDLAAVEFGRPQVAAGRRVSVDFSRIGGDGGDYVYLYAYTPELKLGCLSLPTNRGGSSVSLTLPRCWAGREAHLYGFVWDSDLRCSPTTYLGNITLE